MLLINQRKFYSGSSFHLRPLEYFQRNHESLLQFIFSSLNPFWASVRIFFCYVKQIIWCTLTILNIVKTDSRVYNFWIFSVSPSLCRGFTIQFSCHEKCLIQKNHYMIMSVKVFFINFKHFFKSESGTSMTPAESLTLIFFYRLLYFWNIFCTLALFS
jgi:hypothetical protein